MNDIPNKYKSFPFWSWNDKLDKDELVKQIEWMHERGIGGFFMHARGGLKTPYLSNEWFDCVEACLEKANELGMEAYAYDENGWPSGFVGGKLLEKEENRDRYLTFTIGEFDENAAVSYDLSSEKLKRVNEGKKCLNVFVVIATSTVDICNPDVVKQFIDLTHEEYKKHDKLHNLRGFFTDEPQYYRWNTPYSLMLPKYFKEQYKQDILDGLGLLFVEKEGYEDFRYKYYKALHLLMLKNYGKQVYEWCDKNNYKLTGHYIEESSLSYQMMCCGGIMPFYAFEHIPGVDFLGRRVYQNPIAKQLGSVATQLGKEQRMAEIYAMAGWDATPNELKVITESLMVDGVNIVCQHLLPYKEHGQRKRDYPEHYSAINPWADKSFKDFNDYFANIGMKLSKSVEQADVGLFMPIRSCYFSYKRYETSDPNNKYNLGKNDLAYAKAYKLLQNNHISYHLIDEDILKEYGSVDNDSLKVGKCSYKFLIIPDETITMDKESEKLLKEYVNNGGKVLLLGKKPSYIEGEKFDYPYLTSNVSLEEIIKYQTFRISKTENVISSVYKDEFGNDFLYIVNIGEDVDFLINNVPTHLNKYESKMLYQNDIVEDKKDNLDQLILSDEYKIVEPVDNYLTLDYVSFSKDGINYSSKVNHMGVLLNLIKEKYNGDLYLKYNFNVKSLPSKCFALIEDMNNVDVSVNGNKVSKCGFVLEKEIWKFDIAKEMKIGVNEIIVKINFFESPIVHYALFGENVTESIKNCLVYDTTIEPIYLMGDFGVFGDLKKEEDCYVGNEFYLDKQPNSFKDFILDGFPFFRGNIKLEQIVDVKDVNKKIVISNRLQLIDVSVNDKFVGRMMFNNELDLSSHLVKGENKIGFVYTISNRNLLGPHHLPQLESISVGPNSFEVQGSWDENCKSSYLLDRYSFIKSM